MTDDFDRAQQVSPRVLRCHSTHSCHLAGRPAKQYLTTHAQIRAGIVVYGAWMTLNVFGTTRVCQVDYSSAQIVLSSPLVQVQPHSGCNPALCDKISRYCPEDTPGRTLLTQQRIVCPSSKCLRFFSRRAMLIRSVQNGAGDRTQTTMCANPFVNVRILEAQHIWLHGQGLHRTRIRADSTTSTSFRRQQIDYCPLGVHTVPRRRRIVQQQAIPVRTTLFTTVPRREGSLPTRSRYCTALAGLRHAHPSPCRQPSHGPSGPARDRHPLRGPGSTR